MLIAQLKPLDEILSLSTGKTVMLACEGCKEVYFPENEVLQVQKELMVDGTAFAVIATDYVCNCEHLRLQLLQHKDKISETDTVLVFSCGVGVQTVAEELPGIKVFAACDTIPLPGFQGVTPLEYGCELCGQCYLNATGGVCPITSCSKSLVNGQCGGSKNGKCEVDPAMDCGWERIYRRLEDLNKLDTLLQPAALRDYSAL